MSSDTCRTKVITAFIFLAAAFVLYSNTLHSGLHLDDPHVLGKFRFGHVFGLQPRTITELSFAAQYRLHGMDVAGYHIVNTLVHSAAAYALFLLISLLARDRRPALLGGLLFLVHPLATQAVTYICQRYTSLGALFFFGSLACYVRSRQEDVGSLVRCAAWYAAALLLAFCALLSKEYTASLPLVVLLADFFFITGKGDRPLRRLLFAAPFFLVALAVIGGLYAAPPPEGAPSELSMIPRWAPESVTRASYAISQVRIAVTVYLKLMLLPWGQSIDHDYLVTDRLLSAAVLPSLCMIACLLLAAAWSYRRERLISFGILWFFITLAPTSSVVPNTEFVAEHRAYLPLAGLSFVVAGLYRLLHCPRAFSWAMAVVLVVLSALTYHRNLFWRDEVTLWSDAAAKAPRKARPHATLGKAFLATGDYAKSKAESERALALDPSLIGAYNNLAIVHIDKLQDYDKAREILHTALAREPRAANAYLNLGVINLRQRELPEAAAHFEKAMSLDSRNPKIYFNLGGAYYNMGEYDKAEKVLERGIALWPDDPLLHAVLGFSRFHRGDLSGADASLRRALALDPGNSAVTMYLEKVYRARRGSMEQRK